MCIALISTAHPEYPLILIDNRDEFLHRPTAAAQWWPEPYSYVLGSRDMARSAHGTWLGVTKQGRIAVLTNYRERSTQAAVGVRSRGEVINSFLELPPDKTVTTKQYVEDLVAGGEAQLAGGFSLACGDIRGPLAIVSNRVSATDGITWIAKEKGETVGLSNLAFGDRSWPKIVNGEEAMKEALRTSVKLGEPEDALIQRLLALLSTDTLPRLKNGGDMESYINLLCQSIFIPILGDKEKNDDKKDEKDKKPDEMTQDEIQAAYLPRKVDVVPNGTPTGVPSFMSGAYGTQKQTVVLVHESGRVRFYERTLYDDDAKSIPIGEGDRSFEFTAEE